MYSITRFFNATLSRQHLEPMPEEALLRTLVWACVDVAWYAEQLGGAQGDHDAEEE